MYLLFCWPSPIEAVNFDRDGVARKRKQHLTPFQQNTLELVCQNPVKQTLFNCQDSSEASSQNPAYRFVITAQRHSFTKVTFFCFVLFLFLNHHCYSFFFVYVNHWFFLKIWWTLALVIFGNIGMSVNIQESSLASLLQISVWPSICRIRL